MIDDPPFRRYTSYGSRDAVYYALCFTPVGPLVKIGSTSSLPRRMKEIRKDPYLRGRKHPVLLAVESGGRTREMERHRQFADLRVHREWFTPSTDLLMHMARLAPAEALSDWLAWQWIDAQPRRGRYTRRERGRALLMHAISRRRRMKVGTL